MNQQREHCATSSSSDFDSPVCPLCTLALTPRFAAIRDSVSHEEFSIATCPGCGLGVTIPVPENSRGYYDPDYHGGRHGATAWFCDNRRAQIVRNASRGSGMRRLLDIGCGDGTFLLRMQQDGWSVTGVEQTPDNARKAGIDVRESISGVAGDEPFDCITLWHVLEHLSELHSTMVAIRGLLKKDGVVIIAVPDTNSVPARFFGKWWFHLDVPRHLYHFQEKSLTALLRGHGFATMRARRTEFEYDLMGWGQSALNYFFREPNIFFKVLTGKQLRTRRWTCALHVVLGTFFCGLGLLPAGISSLLGHGGTLIMIARSRIPSGEPSSSEASGNGSNDV